MGDAVQVNHSEQWLPWLPIIEHNSLESLSVTWQVLTRSRPQYTRTSEQTSLASLAGAAGPHSDIAAGWLAGPSLNGLHCHVWTLA